MAIPRHWQTMNIYSPAGTKVWFLGENGLEEQREKALKVLRTDFPYTVTRTDVYGSYTDIFLAEVPGKFNSVMFTEVAPQPDSQLEEAAKMAITHASASAVQHAAYYLAGAITKFEETDKELQKASHAYEEAFNYMTRCREGLNAAIARLSEVEEAE